MTKQLTPALWLMAMALFTACDSGPKAIPEEAAHSGDNNGTGVFSSGGSGSPTGAMDPAAKEDLHTVLALEALPTSKYVYVRVREGADEFWIATTLQEVALGRSYFYRGGLLKTDFVSKEHNRTFDRLYLVTQLVPSDHGSGMAAQAPAVTSAPANGAPLPTVEVPGSTRIADIIADAKRFAGKTIQVSGTCTKVNPNIMGRNWVHIKDKSKGDPELVITTDATVTEGQTVTMIGTVAVDKDFGAGYRYDILLEGGRLIQ